MSCSFPATSERALVCQLSGAPLKCLEGGEACGAAKVSGSPWGHCCQQPLRWSVSSQTKPLVGGGVCGGSHAGQHGSSPDPSRSVSGDKTPLELLLGWPVPGASEGCGLWCQPPQTPPHTLDTCVTCPRVSAAFCDLSGGGRLPGVNSWCLRFVSLRPCPFLPPDLPPSFQSVVTSTGRHHTPRSFGPAGSHHGIPLLSL